jgi:thiol-disulfide isomerase/thioredoxin
MLSCSCSALPPPDLVHMARARLLSHLSIGLSILSLQLFVLGAMAADADAPVDVPDEFGLGERLALVAWLNDHRVIIADPNDIPALRRVYLAKAHPDVIAKPESASQEQERADLAAELYRKFGRNPPPGASVDDITALIASLTEHENELVAHDQEIAHANALANPRSSPPPPTAAQPAAKPAATPGAGSPKGKSRAAAGIIVGKPFPPLTGTCIDGSVFTLSDLKGKVVMVDAWASWCHPCMKEMPNVIAAYTAFHPLGLEIIGISLDHERTKLHQAMDAHRISWPQIIDVPEFTGPLATALVITSIPANFLIDANGILLAVDLRGPALMAELEKVLGKPAAP